MNAHTQRRTTNNTASAWRAPTKNGGIQRIDFSAGMRLKYHDGAAWITGVLRSTEPAILALEDQTEIHTTRQVLADGVRDGLIAVEG